MPLSRSMTTSLGLNGTGVLRLIPGQRSSSAFDSPSACTSAQVHAANTCAPVARGHRRARVPLPQLKSESRLVGMRRASLLLPLSPSRHVVTATHTDSTLPSCKYALAHSDIHDRIARPWLCYLAVSLRSFVYMSIHRFSQTSNPVCSRIPRLLRFLSLWECMRRDLSAWEHDRWRGPVGQPKTIFKHLN